jgi:hypothetical protein
MGSEKDKKKPKSGGGGGGYKWGSGFIWAGGQFAVNWFITYQVGLWDIGSACFSAFIAGWTTSAFVGRFAKWGANTWVLLILGVVSGVAIFSGAFSGLSAAVDWIRAKNVTIDWKKLQDFLFSASSIPPLVLGAMTGLYVKTKFPGGGKK